MSGSNYVNNIFKTMVHLAVLKCMFPYIAIFVILVLIMSCISKSMIEQDNEGACKRVKEYIQYELNIPSYDKRKYEFSFTEVLYNEDTHRYIIKGTVSKNIDKTYVKHFTVMVEAINSSEFSVVDCRFIEK